MDSVPRPVLEVTGLSKDFQVRLGFLKSAKLHAVTDVQLTIGPGRTLAVVGESGSGKTTLGRMVARLLDPSGGSIVLDGVDLTELEGAALASQRARLQMVFQDPGGSLSPWQKVGVSVGEPLEIHLGVEAQRRTGLVAAMLERVGLSALHADRFPHQLSGGQQQRVAIARAAIAGPRLIVLDEPTSALDMSVQAQILLLLKSLQRETSVSYLFISHDLSVVRFIADEVAVMYLGRVVEHAPARDIFERPLHPYTRALIAAAPRPDPHRRPTHARLVGEQPSPINLPPGCPLFGRCPSAIEPCATLKQALVRTDDRHTVACWRYAPPPDLPAGLRKDVIVAA